MDDRIKKTDEAESGDEKKITVKDVQGMSVTRQKNFYFIPREYRAKVAGMNRADRRKWLKRNRRLLIRGDQIGGMTMLSNLPIPAEAVTGMEG